MNLPANLGMLPPVLAGMLHFWRLLDLWKKYNQCNKTEKCEHCVRKDLCKAWFEFVDTHGEYKPYSHFDLRVSLKLQRIQRYVINPNKITTHGFYPFIHFQKKESRYGKKKRNKTRDLYYCAHLDRCVYQRYAFLINYQYNIWAKEHGINEVAIAYRDNLGKNNIDFAKDAFTAIQKYSHCFVMVGDFTDFFNNLNHQYLKDMLCKLLRVPRLPKDYFAIFKNITRFAYWDWKDLVTSANENICEWGIRTKLNEKAIIIAKEQFNSHKSYIHKNELGKGVPQGSPISSVLANVYMIEFDEHVKHYVTEHNGVYMRYSDDFLIVLPYSDPTDIGKFKDWIFQYVNSQKGLLELQEEKTNCYIYKEEHVYELDLAEIIPTATQYTAGKLTAVNYLGFLFDGKNIKIRPKAITKYYYRMRRKVRTIRRSNWVTTKGKPVVPKRLYEIYADDSKAQHRNQTATNKKADKPKQTFISYARRANGILKLNDSEAASVIKNHKHKIAQALKKESF